MTRISSAILIFGLVIMTTPAVRADNSNGSLTITNTLPVASGVSIDSGVDTITLTENTTKNVIVTATVMEDNGCDEITGVGVKFFRSNIAAGIDLVPSAYANNGVGLVRVTVGSLGSPAIVTNNYVDIAGTTGSVYVGQWKVTVISPTEIDLQGSTYTSDPVAKGTVTPNAIKNGAMASDDANNHYTQAATAVGSGNTCTGLGDISVDYTATIMVQYYAEPTDAGSIYAATDWTAMVTPADQAGAGTSDTDTIEMATLVALSVTATIPYGQINLGNDTGTTDQTTTITNTGNKAIGVQVDGFGTTNGDGRSMSCLASGVSIDYEKYHLTASTDYDLKISLSDTPTIVTGFSVAKVTGSPTTGSLYWGFGMPISGVNGSCEGTVVFTAT